jgi:Sec-independent protein translocase protein TatA
MNFFGVGPAEAGLVFVIALIVVGPQRFPEIMRSAGRWYRMARAYSNEVMKDVRSAVDDIEREVKAEADDLKSVRDFADLGADLREAQRDAEALGRETNSVFRDQPAGATNGVKPFRPSQRADDAETANSEAVPPIEQPAQTTLTSEAPAAERPQAKPEPEKPAATFDPFSKEQPKKGPVLIPRETPTTEGDEPKP